MPLTAFQPRHAMVVNQCRRFFVTENVASPKLSRQCSVIYERRLLDLIGHAIRTNAELGNPAAESGDVHRDILTKVFHDDIRILKAAAPWMESRATAIYLGESGITRNGTPTTRIKVVRPKIAELDYPSFFLPTPERPMAGTVLAKRDMDPCYLDANSTEIVSSDWEFAWSLVEDQSGVSCQLGSYAAVYLQECLAIDADRESARKKAVEILQVSGLKVDPDRIVLSYMEPWRDAE